MSAPGRDLIQKALAEGRTSLDEHEAKRLLAMYGVPTPAGAVVRSAQRAAEVVEALGGPAAIKALGPDIQHKSDLGLVALDVRDAAAARAAFHRIVDRAAGRAETGVLVEEFVPHERELLVGMRRDEHFGAVVAFGLGGIFTEPVADVAFALAPLDDADADALAALATGVDGDVAERHAEHAAQPSVRVVGLRGGQHRARGELPRHPERLQVVETVDPDLLAAGAQVKMAGVLRLFHAVREAMGPGSRFVAIAGTLGLEPGRDEAGPGGVNAGLVNPHEAGLAGTTGPTASPCTRWSPGRWDTPRLRRIAERIAAERGRPVDRGVGRVRGEGAARAAAPGDELVWAVEMLLAPEADILHGTGPPPRRRRPALPPRDRRQACAASQSRT